MVTTTVWIEKAITTFAPEYRRSGPLAHGAALVSPTSSSSGADVYRTMREAKTDDLILHLIENEEFCGFSFVESTYRTIEQAGIAMFVVPLRGFQALAPSLTRSVLFSPPFRFELAQLLTLGLRATFFTRDLKFAQGAYLTKAPPSLVAVLDKAYESVAGVTISSIVGESVQN